MACKSCEERARLQANERQKFRQQIVENNNTRQLIHQMVNLPEGHPSHENILKSKLGRCGSCMMLAAIFANIDFALPFFRI